MPNYALHPCIRKDRAQVRFLRLITQASEQMVKTFVQSTYYSMALPESVSNLIPVADMARRYIATYFYCMTARLHTP